MVWSTNNRTGQRKIKVTSPDLPSIEDGKNICLFRPENKIFTQHYGFRSIILFSSIFFLLYTTYELNRDSVVTEYIINTLTVASSVDIINFLTPDDNVKAIKNRLISPYGNISVLRGCEGTETALLMIAAITSFSASWRHKIWGIALGTLFIYAINQARIVALYYSFRHDIHLFELIHGLIAPTLIIFLGSVFFIWWASNVNAEQHKQK